MAYVHTQEQRYIQQGYNLASVLPDEVKQMNEDEFASWMIRQLSADEKQNLFAWFFGLLTVKQYARTKGVAERTVYRWLATDPIKHHAEKLGGTWRIALR